MLNEDKIKLMTGIAMFEKRESKALVPAGRYFRNDYISSQMFRAFFAYSFCCILCALVWILYNIENLLNMINVEELTALGKKGLLLYVLGLVGYLLIAFFVSRRRYEYARRGMKVYTAKLKRLEKRYEFQSRSKELMKEGGRYDGASRT